MANHPSSEFPTSNMPRGLSGSFSLFKRLKQNSRAAIASIRRSVFKHHFASEVSAIRDSGLFDFDYYHQHYSDSAGAVVMPFGIIVSMVGGKGKIHLPNLILTFI